MLAKSLLVIKLIRRILQFLKFTIKPWLQRPIPDPYGMRTHLLSFQMVWLSRPLPSSRKLTLQYPIGPRLIRLRSSKICRGEERGWSKKLMRSLTASLINLCPKNSQLTATTTSFLSNKIKTSIKILISRNNNYKKKLEKLFWQS